MNKFIAVILICAAVGTLNAQPPSQEAVIKEKMKVFSAWVGQWQGEGAIQMGPGDPKKSNVDEKIESKLDDTILLIEGIGKATDPATKQVGVVHNALAILSYDPTLAQYKLRTHVKNGGSTDAWVVMTSENKFQWGFDAPGGKVKIRYSISLDPAAKTWNEIGERSVDGTTWSKFFEMNLKKIE